MTAKFQRAKKQTIKKMDNVLKELILEDAMGGGVVFGERCAFCEYYAVGNIYERGCIECPIYKAVNGSCHEKHWFRLAENALYDEKIDKAIPRILAIKMWIEELEEERKPKVTKRRPKTKKPSPAYLAFMKQLISYGHDHE